MNDIHNIHIIEKTMSFKMVFGSDDLWETGDWHLYPAEVAKIKGEINGKKGNVYLHLNQKAGCHFGGQILDVIETSNGMNRYTIKFRRDPSLVHTLGENWGQVYWAMFHQRFHISSIR